MRYLSLVLLFSCGYENIFGDSNLGKYGSRGAPELNHPQKLYSSSFYLSDDQNFCEKGSGDVRIFIVTIDENFCSFNEEREVFNCTESDGLMYLEEQKSFIFNEKRYCFHEDL